MNSYDFLEAHRRMVGDRVRTDAFRRAIQHTVERGMTVLDAGAGSGILSVFAAQAGAKRVYAVERAPGAAAMARQLAAANGVADIIHVIEDDIARAWLPGKVDVIVSEWLGAFGIDENMLPPVLIARDRWLAPGGRMIPAQVTAWFAPVHHVAAAESLQFRDHPYGVDCSVLAPFPDDQAVWIPDLPVSALRATPALMWSTDCAAMPAAQSQLPTVAQHSFTLTGAANAVATWFSADLGVESPLANGPGDARTHWGNLLFPIVSAVQASEGDVLEVDFHNVPRRDSGSDFIWAARLGSQAREVHDTRRALATGADAPWRIHSSPVEGSLT